LIIPAKVIALFKVRSTVYLTALVRNRSTDVSC
jgi:hypothetical protein